MKRLLLFSLLFFCISCFVSWNKKNKRSTFEELRPYILAELAHSKNYLVNSLESDDAKQKENYLLARKHYKHIEFFIEYCSPEDAKFMINGPLVPKHDPEFGGVIINPMGFQVIESLLFEDSQTLDTSELHRQYRQLIYKFDALHSYYKEIEITDGVLLEMCQYQLYRISSLSLNGYDATILKNNTQEVSWSFEGIEKVIQLLQPSLKKNNDCKRLCKELLSRISSSQKKVNKNPDYDSFDRLEFIVNDIVPLNKLLVEIHKQSGLPWNDRNQALNLKNDNLFLAESFNKRFFSSDYMDTLYLEEQAKLGRLLFFDPLLSGNGERSCASCHNPTLAYTDGLATSKTFGNNGSVLRNAPTLIDLVFQKSFFWDGRVHELEQQIFDVVHNESEMSGNLEDAVVKLRKSDEYRRLFSNAFKGTHDTIITGYAIQKSLVEYERTLISFDSRFDRYLKGDKNALTKREINGFNLFAGKALCGSCHFFPVFNGTVPPLFNDSEFEILGVAADARNVAIDSDIGRYRVTNLEQHKFAFKTPGVRNVELTAPYMHNGAYKTLEQVIDFYHKGGGKGIGFFEGEQTLPFDSLSLSLQEKEDIIFFMKSLTDTLGLISIPKVLPAFNGLHPRAVRGNY